MTKVSDQIIKKIEQDQIELVPVWKFTAKNVIFWSLWALTVLIGSIAVSAMLFVFTHAGWALRGVTHSGTTQFLIDLLPIFWISALLLMIVLGLCNLRHTKTGYRYSLFISILAGVLISFILGALLFVVGMGKFVEDFAGRTRMHESVFEIQVSRWSNPLGGLLAGDVLTLTEVEGEQFVTLESFNGQEWLIEISDLSDDEKSLIEIGNSIAIIGVQDNEEVLSMYACAIIDWDECCFEPLYLTSGRFDNEERSNKCRGVRPFEAFQELISN